MTVKPEHLVPNRTPSRICTRCVMDDTDPEIQFDEHGVCSYCHSQQQRIATEVPPEHLRGQELSRFVEKLRGEGRGKPYDCVIGLSGGVDSSMVAYLLRSRGVRPLGIHLDNGWNAEVSVRNIKNIVAKLGIDLKTHVLDWNEFRDLQVAFLRSGVINLEVPTDHAITALLYRSARKHGLRYIISGSNLATEAIMPPSWGYDNKDWRHVKGIHKRVRNGDVKDLPAAYAPGLVLIHVHPPDPVHSHFEPGGIRPGGSRGAPEERLRLAGLRSEARGVYLYEGFPVLHPSGKAGDRQAEGPFLLYDRLWPDDPIRGVGRA